MLDFGCGCRRVMAYLRRISPAAFTAPTRPRGGCVVPAEPRGSRYVQRQSAHVLPLPFDDAAFDVVYSISVFSHLPEDMHTVWLGDSRRVTKPGGSLLSVQGEAMLPIMLAGDARGVRWEGIPSISSAAGRTAFLISIRRPSMPSTISTTTGAGSSRSSPSSPRASAGTRIWWCAEGGPTTTTRCASRRAGWPICCCRWPSSRR